MENTKALIAARELAEEVIEMAESLASPLQNPLPTRFWETIRDHVEKKLAKGDVVKEADLPFSDTEAARFAREEVPKEFPAYAGADVADVPDWYWCRILDPSEFKKLLRRYLKSDYYSRNNF